MTEPFTAFLALGTNVGDRLANLRRAADLIAAHPRIRLAGCSGIYETEPVGVSDQPWFLNAVVRVETSLSPEQLLDVAKGIEATIGRTPTYRWGPREIDVDLLLYSDTALQTERLTLPHPRMAERLFVLLPLRDVAPDWTTADGTSIDRLIEKARGTEEIRPFPEPLLP